MAAKVPVASWGMLEAATLPVADALAAEEEATEAAEELPDPEVWEGAALAMLDIIVMVLLALLLAEEDPPPTAGSRADAFRLPHCSFVLQLFSPGRLPALVLVHWLKVARQM